LQKQTKKNPSSFPSFFPLTNKAGEHLEKISINKHQKKEKKERKKERKETTRSRH
jgi:hypothetical protein